MISMHGVPSSLILRNESWVRQQAQSIMRRVPSNVEKADLIQVGLIAVAQAALSFVWEHDRDSDEANEAFVRYARLRVKGAMLDELRQMDHLQRSQRRRVKLVELAAQRWRAAKGTEPTAAELSATCHIGIDEIFALRAAASSAQTTPLSEEADADGPAPRHEAATDSDEVEARVETGMLLRRLEPFFARLPQRERQVIDAYLGIGMTPVELAKSLRVTPSRVSQMFTTICERIGIHLHPPGQRAVDRLDAATQAPAAASAWSELVEIVLAAPEDAGGPGPGDEPLRITGSTRWG
jgi:RNA polymerase sigma factor for flagellar operon FliA